MAESTFWESIGVGGTSITIEPGQVLEVAEVLRDQIDAVSNVLRQHESAMRISPPALDIVSDNAAYAWNQAIVDGEGSYRERAQAYHASLVELSQRLRAVAQHYQLDDEDIALAFGDRGA